MWSELVSLNGWPRHPESQESVEKINGSLKDLLVAWMRDNDTANKA